MNSTTALCIAELAIGVVLGFVIWSYVSPALVAVTPPTA